MQIDIQSNENHTAASKIVTTICSGLVFLLVTLFVIILKILKPTMKITALDNHLHICICINKLGFYFENKIDSIVPRKTLPGVRCGKFGQFDDMKRC